MSVNWSMVEIFVWHIKALSLLPITALYLPWGLVSDCHNQSKCLYSTSGGEGGCLSNQWYAEAVFIYIFLL